MEVWALLEEAAPVLGAGLGLAAAEPCCRTPRLLQHGGGRLCPCQCHRFLLNQARMAPGYRALGLGALGRILPLTLDLGDLLF